MKRQQWLRQCTNKILQSAISLAVLLSPTAVLAGPPGTDWVQTFGDEFNGTTLDTDKWGTCYYWSKNGCSNGGSGDVNWYQNDEVSVQNGHLRLRAQKRSMNGYEYTSGMVSSHDRYSFQYGYIEMRAKQPKGNGFWTTFWLIPHQRNVWPPEIDIAEYLGARPNLNHMTLHYRNTSGKATSSTSWHKGPDLTTDYHTYGLLWEPGRLVWYIDGVERKRYENPDTVPSQPMQILATFALGAAWSNTPPDATTPFPSYYDIDYIKVWRHKNGPATPAATPITKEVEDLTVTARKGASQSLITDSQLSQHQGIKLNSYAAGNSISQTVNIPEARTYNVKVRVKKANMRGRFQLSVDGTNYGTAQDLYSPTDSYEELDLGDITFKSHGHKSFQFTTVDKNSKSKGHSLLLDYIKLTPK